MSSWWFKGLWRQVLCRFVAHRLMWLSILVAPAQHRFRYYVGHNQHRSIINTRSKKTVRSNIKRKTRKHNIILEYLTHHTRKTSQDQCPSQPKLNTTISQRGNKQTCKAQTRNTHMPQHKPPNPLQHKSTTST